MVMERLNAAGRLSENKDPVKQFAIKNARRLLLDAGVKDPGPKIERVVVYSSEPRVETKKLFQFSTKACEGLRKEGYMIHSLTGESVKTFLETDRPIYPAAHKGIEVESFSSRLSEVAINPERLFLPNSNRKTFSQQEEMVRQFFLELNSRVPEVEAVIGDVADYVGLVFKHLDATGERLFGEKYNYYYTRTKTQIGDPYVALVGGFRTNDYLYIRHWNRNKVNGRLWIAPLVVPVKA